MGFDGAGTVEAVGSSVSAFAPGDDVYFCNSPFKQACNAEYTLVEAAVASKMPRSLDFTQAASMPLTWLTAWEALVDRLEIKTGESVALLIINGGGGAACVCSVNTPLTKVAQASALSQHRLRQKSSNFLRLLPPHLERRPSSSQRRWVRLMSLTTGKSLNLRSRN
jgi:NADPH:quinone reductase-like Zn-dependent oxidoreductase